MKWENKGHEFDRVFQQMMSKQRFYLFGAGDYGKQFLKIFKEELEILGYIDNSKEKQNSVIQNKACFALEDIKLDIDTGIIVTMSQMARIEPIKQLMQKGYRKNIDYFIIEEFLSIYYAYKYNKVYFSSISFLPSTRCNLNCRHCLNFNPFAKEFYVRDWKEVVEDIDLFFNCVDHIMLFHVSGGEPMLYKYIGEIIQYIDKNYGNKIDTLRTVTNGTVIPPEKVLKRLSECKVEITVDDYLEELPQYKKNFEILIKKLEVYNIKYYVNKVDKWINLAPEKTDYSNMSEEQLQIHRNSCSQSWQELREGKIYSCNYASYAQVAGITDEQDIEEFFDLKKYSKEKMKELIEFRLGYSQKGYTDFCKKCKGFTIENSELVRPAIQTKEIEK